MKLMILFVFLTCTGLFANTFAQMNINAKGKTVREVLKNIEDQSQYRFFYNSEFTDLDKLVQTSFKDKNIDEVLSTILDKTDVSYRIMENNFVIITPVSLMQGITVSGVVTDALGEPMPGVNVIIKGTTKGVVTGVDGGYEISVPDVNAILVFSFIGYKTNEFTVGNQTKIDVKLDEDTQQIEEVVVTALGIRREEKSLGYSVQKVGGEALQVVKGTNIATSLTGKVAGLTVKNSTELIDAPDVTLRGAAPLIVIDNIAYGNMRLKDVSAEDIESLDILKGATASALYGVRGANGAIMVTTKKGEEGKLTVSASNNTMFNAGFLRIPENQTTYAGGKIKNGRLDYDGYVWGSYMDGTEVEQYDGITKGYRKMPLLPRGKDNLKNFIENSYVTTTNLSVSQAGKAGSYRISGTQMHTKGQYPNSALNRYSLAATGTIKYGDFEATGSMTLGKMISPNVPNRVAYGSGNIIYNLIVWTGTDYDVRDFRDYWKVKDEQQNWPWTGWYDNPFFIANEQIYQLDQSMSAGSLNLQYKFNKYLKAILRSGYDSYNNTTTQRLSIGSVQEKNGYFYQGNSTGWSWANDFLLMSEIKLTDFKFDLLGGMGSYYYFDNSLAGSTKGGISIPGFYSLASSVEQANVSKSESGKLMYSAYGKFSASYKSMAYLDMTGRNDWSSTLSSDNRSYFYPSIALSFIPTEIYNPLEGSLDFWKLRGSWTISKRDPSVYANNLAYSVSSSVWNSFSSATYPSSLNDPNMMPNTEKSLEFGTNLRFFGGRLFFDYTWFSKRQYNRIISASISGTSGFTSMEVNTDEDRIQKGMEITLRGQPVLQQNFGWMASFNIGFYHWYYNKFDEQYSSDDPRITKGTRTDRYMMNDWQKDRNGNAIISNGLPITYPYTSLLGYADPKFVFGFTNDFSIWDFDLHISFDGRIGGVMYAQTNQAMWNAGSHPGSVNQYRYDEVVNGKKYIVDGVKVKKDENGKEIGKLVADEYGNIISDDRVFETNDVGVAYSSYVTTIHGNAYTARPDNIVDPSFVKLRELAINYNIPQKFTQKVGIKKATVGIIGQNLWMWTKSKEFKYSDPDRGVDQLNSPSVRLLGFNINMTF